MYTTRTTTGEIREESSSIEQEAIQPPLPNPSLLEAGLDRSSMSTEVVAQLSRAVPNSVTGQILADDLSGGESELHEQETQLHETTFFRQDELLKELKPRIGAEIEGTTIIIRSNPNAPTLKGDYHDKQIAVSKLKFGNLGFEDYADIPIMDATLEGKDGSVEFRPSPFPLESIDKKVFIVYVKWIKTLINKFIHEKSINSELWECKIDTHRYSDVPETERTYIVKRTGTKFDSISGFHATTSIPISKFYGSPDEETREGVREFYEDSVAPESDDLHENLVRLASRQNVGSGLGSDRIGIRNVFKTPIDAIALSLMDQGKEGARAFCEEYDCEDLYPEDTGNSYPSELQYGGADRPIRHLGGSRKLMPPLRDREGELRVLVESRQDSGNPIPINKLYHDTIDAIMKSGFRELIGTYGIDRSMLTGGDIKTDLRSEESDLLHETIPLIDDSVDISRLRLPEDSKDLKRLSQQDRILHLLRLARLLST